jgi:hypothetical protein
VLRNADRPRLTDQNELLNDTSGVDAARWPRERQWRTGHRRIALPLELVSAVTGEG